jgi:hypothetical protein
VGSKTVTFPTLGIDLGIGDRIVSSEETKMALEKEIETYNRELPRLMESIGKFALISASDVVGVYDTYEDALKVGYERFKLAPFLVKQIQAVEQVQYFTRHLAVCPT